MPRGVARIVQRSRQSWRARVEPLGHSAPLIFGSIIEVRRDVPARGILARREGNARWRADRSVDVELLESNPFGCETVDIRGFDFLVAEAGEVAPAHIVDQDENDIWMGVRSFCGMGPSAMREKQR